MKVAKRSGAPLQQAAKRRKTASEKKGKDKAADRPVIPIPVADDDDDSNLSEQDLDLLENYGVGAGFLKSLDQDGIARSKKETARLHQVNKPIRQKADTDDLPSIHSDSEGDDESWSSGIDHDELSSPTHDVSDDSDAEMPIKQMGGQPVEADTAESEDEDEEKPSLPVTTWKRLEDVSTGARFGRASVVDVLTKGSRKTRIQQAKDQIAGICQDIVAEPEMSLGLLRRLHVFASETVTSPSHPEPIKNDPMIRKLAILSQLAVFIDIIPGYRIRALTDQEKSEKGLVGVYQNYLRILEAELKAQSELTDAALQCLCTLLKKATHFNFIVNVMGCIVGRLSKKSWNKSSELCIDAVIHVFRADLTGQPSLELVRLLNRMIKERRYNIHPNVLSCLPFLRLKTELSVRASDSKTDKPAPVKNGKRPTGAARRKIGDAPHVSKKNAKILKENKEIEREFREAEAEVDREQRMSTQTETLKLLFVLYFSILKATYPTPLLPCALEGISKFAHLVNIDFFKDLLQVLKKLIQEDDEDDDELISSTHRRLLCIITAFDLLSGQGEALNIDLTDFVSHLYTIIPPLSLASDIDRPIAEHGGGTSSLANKLFRALDIVFSPRSLGATAPSWRSAAFAKRLLGASLHWPPTLALRSLNFVDGLILKDEKLENLLFTEERSLDGVYRPDIDDPQLCNPFGTSFWELYALRDNHYDTNVREEAQKIVSRAQAGH
ncbi:NOC3p-domain-containing protein [Hymenopellis radicata]|nr:NOC3p-domain-containing protein [Hymenopellis radicata]